MESHVVMDDNTVFVLLGVSGVASTFAGFAGVVATFGRRAEGQWLPEERFRLINMIVLSLVACLFSFVPLIEDLFHLDEVTLWTVASVLLSILCAVYFVYAVPQRWRLEQSRHGALRPWMAAALIIAFGFAIVLQAFNATGVLVERGAGPYVAGLSLLLTIAGLQFAFLVLTPLNSTEQ
jgi:peptidoglycan/LPS O-acetylase OafA/YrhL